MRRALPLLMLALTTSAAGAPLGELQVASLTAEGYAFATGTLVAVEVGEPADGIQLPLGVLSLHAAKIHLETDWAHVPLRLAGAGILPREDGTQPRDHEDAKLTSTEARPLSYLFLASLAGQEPPHVSVVADRIEAHLPATGTESSHLWVDVPTRSAASASLAHAVQMETGEEAHLSVEGSFLLILWDVDYSIEDAYGATDYWTGEHVEPASAAPPETADSSRKQQVYLIVQGGRLEIELAQPASIALHDAEMAAEDRVSLQGAAGSLLASDGRRSLADEDVLLDGPVRLGLGRSTQQGLPVVVHEAGPARVDGQRFLLAVEKEWPWQWVAAGLAALAVAAGLLLRTHRERTCAALRIAMDQGDYDRVRRLGPRLFGGRHGAEAAVALATVHARDEDADAILTVLERPRRWPARELAARAYLQAFAHALRGEADLAKAHLAQCIRLEPRLANEARHHPLLRGFLPQVAYNHDGDVA